MNKLLVLIVIAGILVLAWTQFGSRSHPRVFSSTAYADAVATNRTDSKILLVKLTADWCGPCKMMDRTTFVDPRVEKWIQDHGSAIVVDVDHEKEVAGNLKIFSIPTMILYVGGEERSRRTGALSADDLLEWMEIVAKKG